MLLQCAVRLMQFVNMFKLFCLFASIGRLNSELNLPIKGIEQWAVNFGNAIFKMSEEATALQELQMDYLLMDTKVESIRGKTLIRNMKQQMERMLSKKATAMKAFELPLDPLNGGRQQLGVATSPRTPSGSAQRRTTTIRGTNPRTPSGSAQRRTTTIRGCDKPSNSLWIRSTGDENNKGLRQAPKLPLDPLNGGRQQ
ncbi:hypothetical protein LSAT2_016708 [Lamellibrachia satsuma]|nr:hypothetical protein LSAT2_016708 [Lamellibrachia satsuma]